MISSNWICRNVSIKKGHFDPRNNYFGKVIENLSGDKVLSEVNQFIK